MNINPTTIAAACQTGLKMLTSESINTPNAWNTDLATLTQVLLSVVNGHLVIIPASQLPSDEPIIPLEDAATADAKRNGSE